MVSPTPSHRRIAAVESVLPPAVTPDGTRGRILSSALLLFAERGYGGTSVRDICARAALQATTLYAHFPSKEHVLAEIITLAHEELYRRLHAALLESGADPEDQLIALVRSHVISHCEYTMLAVVASAELHMLTEALAAPILALRQQAEALLVTVLERGVKKSVFEVPDAYLALRAISGMGLRVAYWFEPECGYSPEQVADIYTVFARRVVGLGGRETA